MISSAREQRTRVLITDMGAITPLGHTTNSDAYHFVAPDPQATGAIRPMQAALCNARVTTDQVDYINAHATSTPLNDPTETMAIKPVFGARTHKIPISATKSMIGHSIWSTLWFPKQSRSRRSKCCSNNDFRRKHSPKCKFKRAPSARASSSQAWARSRQSVTRRRNFG